jgi:geranylgeranyl reductase family protein
MPEADTFEACDVLVVGGGPAGSTCARHLSRAGLDVLVIDKAEFPRDKICAGWVTPAVMESLELDTADYASCRVLQPITGFRTGMLGAEETETRYGKPVSYGIRRCEFDDYLLRRSGARLKLGFPFKTMQREGERWLVNGSIRTPLVVGAGGNFCPVARRARNEATRSETLVVAQEIEFALPHDQIRACGIDPEVPQFYFCRDLAGYGWCFAKGNYLNVGLGREDSHRLSSHVDSFVDWLKSRGSIPQSLPGKLNGHAYLLHQASRRAPLDDGVMLVGDALGLAYARSGEGIRPAVESGMLAAAVIERARGDYRASRLRPYEAQLSERFGNREDQGDAAAWLPAGLRQALAARLLASNWFARNVVIDRWFLHAQQGALHLQSRGA